MWDKGIPGKSEGKKVSVLYGIEESVLTQLCASVYVLHVYM